MRPGRRQRHFTGGYYFPLNSARALSLERGSAYIAECVERARRNPESARNVAARARQRKAVKR